MPQPKKLIEVALPVKEVSAESVRDKSIRHGHISTLHLWWARRPLPVCRAVVFASLVPDPLDPHCPPAFTGAVNTLLAQVSGKPDHYKPYKDIPYTSAIDEVADNERNRLLMFIGKFSDEFARNEKSGKVTAAGKQLSDASLIKWDNKNNEAILNIARKLIWVAHNAATQPGATAKALLADFDAHYNALKKAEEDLYAIPDRHLETAEVRSKTAALEKAKEAFLDKMPRVFDPFAGGGAIPLEAARLGCRTFGNDINPVAHIIQKGSLEYPQRFGKPITYTKAQFIARYGEEAWKAAPPTSIISVAGEATGIRIANRLSFDVNFYARKLLALAEKEIGHLYPAVSPSPSDFESRPERRERGPGGEAKKPIAYYWARTGTCSNPSCRAEVPLLKGFYLVNKPDKKVYLNPIINGTQIDFEIKNGTCRLDGWNLRTNLTCPCCGSITESKVLKGQFRNGKSTDRLLAVIEEGKNKKEYRLPIKEELSIFSKIPADIERPTDRMEVGNDRNFNTPGWGISDFGQMFSNRQLLAMQTLVAKLSILKEELLGDQSSEEYGKAIVTYLGILIDRIAIANTSFGRWHTGRETLEHPFSKQAIPMMFDYPESNMFCDSTGSALNQLAWITRYIESEGECFNAVTLQNASSGQRSQFPEKYLTAVVTDPPYYDAIAYADLSDFFYVWLKRTLGDVFPENFAYPQTPKSEECTALKHHHNGSKAAAMQHFEHKLLQIFDAIEHQTSDIVSIMFAHQSTEAWTTLCNSILGARMNITGSWPVDTEMANRSLGLSGAVLASSITVSCRPAQRQGTGDFKEVRSAIEARIKEEVRHLYALGFRGADLLTACFGQAVSEFGRYQTVEKANGTEVTVEELLKMARDAAFNALVSDFPGDDFTKFYLGWLQLYGFSESAHDDVARLSQVGLSLSVGDLVAHTLLLKKGNTETLATFKERMSISGNSRLGLGPDAILIDQVHRAMHLFDTGGERAALLGHIARFGAQLTAPFWRVLTSIAELSKGSDDGKAAAGLLTDAEGLIRESNLPAEVREKVQGEIF